MIYLDFNASTPIAPEVQAVMRSLMETAYGNPSSKHAAGTSARAAIDKARAQVAKLLGATSEEIVFTSGGSEATNAAIKGAYWALPSEQRSGAHIVTTNVEHPATLEACAFLERLGATVTKVAADATGRVDAKELASAIRPNTFLVTVMHANNEVGTIQPIAEIGLVTRQRGILFHVDAAQSLGKIPVRVNELAIDLLTIAGHKLYAPKGVGAMYIRGGVKLEPLIHGGGHESGRRAGTESAILCAALGVACELAEKTVHRAPEVRVLRDRLWDGIRSIEGANVHLNGHPEHRLPNTLNVSFAGRVGAELIAACDGLAASTGSACHSGSVHLSPVLRAMGVEPHIGMGAVRFSLGTTTTEKEIDQITTALAKLF